jgi:hypothetical protein
MFLSLPERERYVCWVRILSSEHGLVYWLNVLCDWTVKFWKCFLIGSQEAENMTPDRQIMSPEFLQRMFLSSRMTVFLRLHPVALITTILKSAVNRNWMFSSVSFTTTCFGPYGLLWYTNVYSTWGWPVGAETCSGEWNRKKHSVAIDGTFKNCRITAMKMLLNSVAERFFFLLILISKYVFNLFENMQQKVWGSGRGEEHPAVLLRRY